MEPMKLRIESVTEALLQLLRELMAEELLQTFALGAVLPSPCDSGIVDRLTSIFSPPRPLMQSLWSGDCRSSTETSGRTLR